MSRSRAVIRVAVAAGGGVGLDDSERVSYFRRLFVIGFSFGRSLRVIGDPAASARAAFHSAN